MVTPVTVKIGEKADVECCYKSNCCLWRRKHKKGDISPVSPSTLKEIEKAVDVYEKRRASVIDPSYQEYGNK